MQVIQGPDLPLGVAVIEVTALYGKFNYRVDLLAPVEQVGEDATDQLLSVSEDRLTLLYGRNGSGKTSLLRLLFHAIAAGETRGHRTELARTEFQRFAVTLTDGTILSYARDDGRLTGGFLAKVARPGHELVAWDVTPNEEGAVKKQQPQVVISPDPAQLGSVYVEHETDEARFLAALHGANLNPIFLADSRGIVGDMLEPADRREAELQTRWSRQEEARRVTELEDAIDLVRRYLAGVVFAGAQEGSSKVDSVYLNVTRAISEHEGSDDDDDDVIPHLIQQVNEIGARVDLLHSYGLMAEFPTGRLTDQLGDSPKGRAGLLRQVLGPYLEGLEKRIEALEPGLRAVSAFIDALNSFLQGKTAEFHLGPKGIVIRDDDTGRLLGPAELSSGERQVVLLFSDVVALQNETRLFIIDEPELSLNPEWQRQLMPRLLTVTEQSKMQILVATHSIEILAQYRARIHNLGQV